MRFQWARSLPRPLSLYTCIYARFGILRRERERRVAVIHISMLRRSNDIYMHLQLKPSAEWSADVHLDWDIILRRLIVCVDSVICNSDVSWSQTREVFWLAKKLAACQLRKHFSGATFQRAEIYWAQVCKIGNRRRQKIWFWTEIAFLWIYCRLLNSICV